MAAGGGFFSSTIKGVAVTIGKFILLAFVTAFTLGLLTEWANKKLG
jgi:hypothetical protein